MKNNNGKFRKKKIYFTQVSNYALRDKYLSFSAKGLYSLIQSYITIPDFDLYKSFWGRRKVKPVRFDLKCDCYYIAYVPKSVKLKSIFGIKIEEVKDLKELDQYQEYLGQFDNE